MEGPYATGLDRRLGRVLINLAWSARLAECSLYTTNSTGRCNTDVKPLYWGFESQGHSGPFIELTRYFVQMGL